MLYIIYHKTDYINFIFEGIDLKLPIKFVELQKECTIFQRSARHFFPEWFPGIPSLFIGKNLRQQLSSLRSDDTILVINYLDYHLLKSLQKLTRSKVKRYLWLWNPIKKNNALNYFQTIKELGFYSYTYEPQTAKNYGIGLLSQFYRMNIDLPDYTQEYEYDFYFLGLKKERGDKIDEIKTYLIKNGYSVFFYIVENSKDAIPYEQNVQNILKTKCIVEIVDDDLEGITLRPLEAIAFKKKLFTNNKNIIHSDLYDKQNIYIYGSNNNLDLFSFLNSEIKTLPNNLLSKYDINTWIKKFI